MRSRVSRARTAKRVLSGASDAVVVVRLSVTPSVPCRVLVSCRSVIPSELSPQGARATDAPPHHEAHVEQAHDTVTEEASPAFVELPLDEPGLEPRVQVPESPGELQMAWLAGAEAGAIDNVSSAAKPTDSATARPNSAVRLADSAAPNASAAAGATSAAIAAADELFRQAVPTTAPRLAASAPSQERTTAREAQLEQEVAQLEARLRARDFELATRTAELATRTAELAQLRSRVAADESNGSGLVEITGWQAKVFGRKGALGPLVAVARIERKGAAVTEGFRLLSSGFEATKFSKQGEPRRTTFRLSADEAKLT